MGPALRACLPRSAQERDYALITATDALGTGSFLAISVVLFVRLVGVSPTQVGTALGIAGLIGLFTRVPLSRLSDRIGHRTSLVIVHLVRGLAFPGYLLVHGFAPFFALCIVVMIMDGWERPLRKVVLFAVAPPAERVRISAYNRSVYSLAFSAGSLLAALALAVPADRLALQVVVTGNAASFLLAAALAARLPADRPGRAHSRNQRGAIDRQFALVGLLLGVMFICPSVLSIGIPLLVLQKFNSHQWLIGVALALNTVVAVLFQLRLSRGCDDTAGSIRAGLTGGLVLVSASGLFFVSAESATGPAVVVLLLAVVVLSAGELLALAATWGLSVSLRPHDLSAHNQSLWSLFNSAPSMAGPVVVAWSLHALGDYGWLVLAALFTVPAALLGPVARSGTGRAPTPTRTSSQVKIR